LDGQSGAHRRSLFEQAAQARVGHHLGEDRWAVEQSEYGSDRGGGVTHDRATPRLTETIVRLSTWPVR
jgi:hypothetical protein